MRHERKRERPRSHSALTHLLLLPLPVRVSYAPQDVPEEAAVGDERALVG